MLSTEAARLTVAIPTYNGATHLGEALRGVLAQTDVRFDLIVSDDRSDDDTLAVIRREVGDRARVEANSERLGLARNWNRLVERTTTPFVSILHQDDVFLPGHIRSHLDAFEADPSLGLVASNVTMIDGDGRAVPPSVVEPGGFGDHDATFPHGRFVRELAFENPLRCSAVSIRVEAHRSVGGFDPSYRYVVDWDFWYRVAETWGAAYLAARSVQVRWHGASETHRFKVGTLDLEETARLTTAIATAHSPSWPDAADLRRRRDRRLSRAYLNRAYEAAHAGDHALKNRSLKSAVGLWPGILGTIARDPRLAARLLMPFVGRKGGLTPPRPGRA